MKFSVRMKALLAAWGVALVLPLFLLGPEVQDENMKAEAVAPFAGASGLCRVDGDGAGDLACGHPSCTKMHDRAAGWNDRRAAKVDAAFADSLTCAPPALLKDGPELSLTRDPGRPRCLSGGLEKTTPAKRISVAALVEQALDDQVRLLQAKQTELNRWDRTAQVHFHKWFGATDEKARQLIRKRVAVVLQLNDRYSVNNFRRAVPSRPGLFAFVRANDPSKVFVDLAFVKGPPVGENSRAGTITHEMSHFTIVGGTKDFAYGKGDCKALARSAPLKALFNADNFEYYVEGVR